MTGINEHPWGEPRARCPFGEDVAVGKLVKRLWCSQRVGHRGMHSLIVSIPNHDLPVRCHIIGTLNDGHHGQCILLAGHKERHHPEPPYREEHTP